MCKSLNGSTDQRTVLLNKAALDDFLCGGTTCRGREGINVDSSGGARWPLVMVFKAQ
jgi:hypothetical protein